MFFMLLLISCSHEAMIDEMTPPEVEPKELKKELYFSFSSEGNFSCCNSFVVLSDKKGETLYDTLSRDLEFEIKLQIDTSTVVSATIGYVEEEEFNIVSYSDIQSGSQLNLYREWETHPCLQSDPV
jgi:hypothetical protein